MSTATRRSFANWILGIASHYCIDQLRRRSTETKLFNRDVVESAVPQAAFRPGVADRTGAHPDCRESPYMGGLFNELLTITGLGALPTELWRQYRGEGAAQGVTAV